MTRLTALFLMALPVQGHADFTESNLLAIFYHELGHAMVDQMGVPIFGQEEDAADTLSILLIDALYDDASAETMAYDSSSLFWAEAESQPAFWDTHGPDLQRYFNTVCLFYGADPDAREDFAADLELPEERAIGCEEEFALASESWNSILDEMADDRTFRGALVLAGEDGMPVIADEIDALNAEFRWPQDIPVRVGWCDEANAFYDLETQSITMCLELIGWLDQVASDIGVN